MSEEILKALMQLFAILARQDGILIEDHETYVLKFLSSQLSSDRVQEHMLIYRTFLEEGKVDPPSAEQKDKNRTSMKDSVRTLSICKKINKTLIQKQKVIVLIRLLEFFKKDSAHSQNRIQIVETVAEVFKIEKSEFTEIRDFVFEPEEQTKTGQIIIGDSQLKNVPDCKQYIGLTNYTDTCKLIYLKSIHLVILKYHGLLELYLNGMVIEPETIYVFPQGSTLKMPQTTIYYSNIIVLFNNEKTAEEFSFTAHITEHKFPNGTVALNELKIEERSGNLIGIMGASGSGKTTLLTILSGQEQASNGVVLINETPVDSSNKDLNGLIGYVPQDDLLIEDLTVYQNLYYSAKLCFKDLNDEHTAEKIQKTLSSLGLEEIKDIKVGNALNKKISGGQRKRLNIALELLRQPRILFLDEPTSGLSSRDSENVMDLLKELTFGGTLVFVVIHQPSSDIFKMFDKLFILDKGGFAAYYGNPIESVTYFKRTTRQINSHIAECSSCGSVNPETIFNLLELKEIDEYGNYTRKRKLEPAQFYALYKQKFFENENFTRIKEKIKTTFNSQGKLKQTLYFFLRDLHSKLGNKQYILINSLEVPVLVLFLSLIIRYIDKTKSEEYSYYHNYNIPAYFFMAIIAALLVGLTISAEEIYKDEKILKRERLLHLSRLSYLLSKVIILFIISLIQSILFTLIGHIVLEIHSGYFHFFLMILSVFCFANLLGLILSSTFNSPVTIYIIIPLIIIPQLLLGGAMFSYSKLNSLFGGGFKVPALANFMVSRWAYEGIIVDMHTQNPYNEKKYVYDKLESRFNYKIVYFIPKAEELVNRRQEEKGTLYANTTLTLRNELAKDYTEASALGFSGKLPDFSNPLEILTYLEALNTFYSDKYNQAFRIKEQFVTKQVKLAGNRKKYEVLKLRYLNNRLDEVVTASYEKEKIAELNNTLVQLTDPVYKTPDATSTFGSIDVHFLTAEKYIFGKQVTTYYFNLIIIWLINLLLFLMLHLNLFRKLFSVFDKKTISSIKLPNLTNSK